MRGITGATAAVAAHLTATLPAKVDELDGRLAYPPDAPLEAPELITTEERPRLDGNAWPAIFVAGQDTTRVDLDDPNVDGAGAVRYRITYRLRILCFVRGATFADVTRRIGDLTLAVREVILPGARLDAYAAEPGHYDPTDLAESYSDVGTTDARRSIAASYVDVSVIMEETLSPAEAGADVATITVHPALLDD